MQLSLKTGNLILGFLLFITLVISSCKKDSFLTDGGTLSFSSDTLTFDTVFTQIASFTMGIKMYNDQNKPIKVSSVRLEQGANSFYNLNVDGKSGNVVTDVEIAANDSIYIFATVKIDPTNDNKPFLVKDKLIATLNGKDFSIPFIAFGQNAHYVTDSILQTDTWLTDKPYVIVRSALIDKNQTLTIPAGCKIYMNADSRLYVLGTLKAEGTKQDSIIFQGDRLDRKYFGNEDYPGEWGGLYIDTGSTGNVLDWVIIKNAGTAPGGGFPSALWVSGKGNNTPQLRIDHTIIQNSFGYGLICFNASISMENSLIHSTGAQAMAVFQGGNYSIRNCSFINYFPSKVSHVDNPTMALLNYYEIAENQFLVSDLKATVSNCLIYGSLDDELIVNRLDNTPATVSFNNCLIKSKTATAIPNWVTTSSCKYNTDPQFKDFEKNNYRIGAETSPCYNAGMGNTLSASDLDNTARVKAGIIDIGCYEF